MVLVIFSQFVLVLDLVLVTYSTVLFSVIDLVLVDLLLVIVLVLNSFYITSTFSLVVVTEPPLSRKL